MKEKERILSLLEAGKITADEATRLLEALKTSYRPEVDFMFGPHPHHHFKHIKHKMKTMKRMRHFHPLPHPLLHPFSRPRKIVVKMRGACMDPDDIEITGSGRGD
jgi:hypothetical protein